MIKIEDLDKRICDVEEDADNEQTYREFIEEGMEEFNLLPIDFENESDISFYLDFIDGLWDK